jgi:hypothetical protein
MIILDSTDIASRETQYSRLITVRVLSFYSHVTDMEEPLVDCEVDDI